MTDVAAMRLPEAQRRWPAWTSYLGLSLCLLLAVTLQLLTTVVVLEVGVGITAVIAARRGGSVPGP